jgi:hypothetical protein
MGSNWGGFVSVINAAFGRAPWCMAAVYKAFKDSGCSVVKTNTVTVFADWAHARGYDVSRTAAERGDVIVFEWDGYWPGFGQWRDILDHVGMVAERKGQMVRVVEGNAGDRMRTDRWFAVSSSLVKGFFRVPGPVDPRAPGAPYVTRAYPLPVRLKTAGKSWVVRLGKTGRVIFRGGKSASLKVYREKLAYWQNRNRNRR